MLSLVLFETSFLVGTEAGQVDPMSTKWLGLKNHKQPEKINFSQLIVVEILKMELEICAFQLDKSVLIVSNLFKNYIFVTCNSFATSLNFKLDIWT